VSRPRPGAGWEGNPNLRHTPHAPNAGKGRIQTAVRRAFIGHPILSTSQVYDWCFARDRRVHWQRRNRWSVVRVLDQVADRIGRHPRHGAIIWRLRADTSSGSAG
jgi:hypothetical protein